LNFPLYIAKRYIRSKSSQNAVNIINFITFLVIVIGSAALFVVLSGFAGLKTFSLQFSESFDPDLKATPLTGKFMSISNEQEKSLSDIDGLVIFSKELEEKVYLQYKQKSDLAFIKGVDENYNRVTGIDSTLYFGSWKLNQQQAVAGLGISNLLGVPTNNYRNPIEVLVPKVNVSSANQVGLNKSYFNKKNIVLSGVYNVNEDLDKKYVFADYNLVQDLLGKDSLQFSGINFKLDVNTDETKIRTQITNVLGENIILKNRQEQNSSLHKMLNTENLVTYLIFTLVLIIALFNVVGAITMMILDKQQNSKTLYHLGTTIKELQRIYFVQGALVTAIGGLVGVFIGSLLIWSQLFFGWVTIGPIEYPVEYNFINVLLVLATIIVLGVIAARIASGRINKKLIQA